jgi:very-short-patch-repair endonuclease
MIEERLASSHLIQLHRGVYAVGHKRLRREGHWLAAVLAIGPGAVLSHRHAAALHGIRSVAASQIDVSTTKQRRAQAGIRIYSRRQLDPADVTTVAGIPVTAVARTLVDLAATVSRQQLERAVSESERLGLFDLTHVEQAMAHTKAGRAALRAALTNYRSHGETTLRSELEARFLALLDDRQLPRPRMNSIIEGMEIDAVWRQQRLAVELDGWAAHHHRRAFQDDRTKANDLTAAGYAVLRFTYRDVTDRAADTAARISQALAAARPLPRSARRAR